MKLDKEEKILFSVLAPLALLIMYMAFIVVPVILYTEAECLKDGYPEHRVTIGLERYCMTLDGAVTVKVDKK